MRIKHENTTLSEKDTQFAIADTASIDRITLTKFSNKEKVESIVLERQKDGWRINNKHDVRPDKITMLLTVLLRIEVREPLHPNAISNVYTNLDQSSTRVDVEGAGDISRSYIIGEKSAISKGTYALMNGAQQPCIIHLPGMAEFVRPYVSSTTQDWRDNRVFALNPREVYRIEVQTPGNAEKCFVVENQRGQLYLSGNPQADTSTIQRYINRFQSIPARSFAENLFPNVRDSLSKHAPLATVTVRDRQGYQRKLILHNRKDVVNTMFGWVEGENELLLMQNFSMDSVLVSRNYFQK